MTSVISFSQEKMFVRGDFDMNSVERYTDSLQEAFKQTIMNQDVIFRKQVHELHRLYRVQITLMKDIGCKDFGTRNSWKESTQLSLMPHTNPIVYEPQLQETRFSSISMVDSSLPKRKELLEGCQDMHYKLQQPLDLQIQADQYISHADNNFRDKGNVSNHIKHTLESHINNESYAMDLKLSLSLGVDSRRREGAKKSCFDKKTHSCPQVVIDLEESDEGTSTRDAEQAPSLGSTGLIMCCVGKHESNVSVLSNLSIPRSVEKNKCHEIVVNSLLVDDGECCQERQSSNQEFKDSQDDIPCNYVSVKKQQKLASCDARHLDLNKVQLDDSSCYSNDPMMAYPSSASSSGAIVGSENENFSPTTIWRKEINNCSRETSHLLQQDDNVNVALVDSDSKNKGLEIWHSGSKLNRTGETEVSPTGLESISQLPMDLSEYHGSCCSDPENNRDKLTSKLHGGSLNDLNCSCVETKQKNCDKRGVENFAYSCSGHGQDKHGNKCAASCKSCCTVDKVSSSIKITQSGIQSGNSTTVIDQFSGIHVHSEGAEIFSGDQDQRSSGNSEQGCINKKIESIEVDVLIQRAAKSLIHISLENSACFPDCSTRSESNKTENEENEENEQPQNSSDSFEAIALKLTESSSDDHSVSSKPFEVNAADKRDFGIKLRRGRRLKDFQKDILPGLASLSRLEICEDINILEGVLRSKEYKRNRARMGDDESWCPPLRRRRTRFNYVRRRNFR